MVLRRGQRGSTLQPAVAHRQKQLIFDKRYGWVFAEWIDPIEVAHLGGRGMFSIVPLTSSALHAGWLLANKLADEIVSLVISPKPLLPQLTQQLSMQASDRLELLQHECLYRAEPLLRKWQEGLNSSSWKQRSQSTLQIGQEQWWKLTELCQAQVGHQPEKLRYFSEQGKHSLEIQFDRLQQTVASGQEQLSKFAQESKAQMIQRVPELREQAQQLKALTSIQLQRLPLLHAFLRSVSRSHKDVQNSEDSRDDVSDGD